MEITEFTDRQRFAIEHPNDRNDGVARRAPRGAVKKKGKWLTILEISREPGRDWTWMASISRQRAPGSSYKIKQWKSEWFAEADAILRELLEGVGGDDIDVQGLAKAAGHDTSASAGYHLWRLLTPQELAAMESLQCSEEPRDEETLRGLVERATADPDYVQLHGWRIGVTRTPEGERDLWNVHAMLVPEGRGSDTGDWGTLGAMLAVIGEALGASEAPLEPQTVDTAPNAEHVFAWTLPRRPSA